MASPPLLAGAVQVMLADPLPAVAVPTVGAPGVVAGTTALDGSDSGPLPTAEVAAPSTVACWPPGEAVTTKDVMELPPSAGAVHETVAEVSPGTAVPIAGASGTVAGVTAAEDADSGPSPTLLVAWTVKV